VLELRLHVFDSLSEGLVACTHRYAASTSNQPNTVCANASHA